MFSYPVEFLQMFVSHTLILAQRLLLLSTLITLLSITFYLSNNPPIRKSSHLNYENNKLNFCYKNTYPDTLTAISHWSRGNSIGSLKM